MEKSAFDNFSESAQEALDFARCQRADGSYYGTGGVCRKGSSVGPKEKEASSGKVSTADAKKLSKDLTRQIGEADKKGDSAAVQTLMKAKGDVDATIKARGGGGGSVKDVKALDKAAKDANKKADAAEKAWRKGGAKPGKEQKEVRRLDKEAKAADKAADKAAKGLSKMRAQDQKLQTAQAKVNQQLKTAKGERAKTLRGKRADLQEARTKLKYQMKGLGGAQSRLTGDQVRGAVGTVD